jgi:hypothetical protein
MGRAAGLVIWAPVPPPGFFVSDVLAQDQRPTLPIVEIELRDRKRSQHADAAR